MADSTKPPAGPETARGESRQDRLAEALRANLHRRKAQKRGRDEAQADLAGPENPAPTGEQAPTGNQDGQ